MQYVCNYENLDFLNYKINIFCQWKMGSVVSGLRKTESVDILRLPSNHDNDVIRSSWDCISDKQLLGQQIFKRIFEEKPGLKRSFKLQSIPNEKLADETVFISHSQNFTDFLIAIVGSLGNGGSESEGMAAIHARSIGSRHAQISMFDASLFDPVYWTVFTNCAASVIVNATDSKRNDKMRVKYAWQMLLLRLMLEMKVAFYKELQRLQQQPTGVNAGQMPAVME